MNARRLLILACSSTKTASAGAVAARERYNGPLWQTLRVADPHGSRAFVAFVSAQYGVGTAETLLPFYDRRLTPALAAAMIAAGVDAPWPDAGGARACDAIAELAARAGGPFVDVALVGGALYLAVMRSFLDGFQRMGHVAENARVCEVQNTIGRMRRELRAWLAAPAPIADLPPAPIVEGELIVDESGYGFMPPEFARARGGTWISLRPLGVPLPKDVTPRRSRRARS